MEILREFLFLLLCVLLVVLGGVVSELHGNTLSEYSLHALRRFNMLVPTSNLATDSAIASGILINFRLEILELP